VRQRPPLHPKARNISSCPIPQQFLRNLPKLPLSDPKFYESTQIDILIGADELSFILLSGTRPIICGSLLGQETIFGWILTGPVSVSTRVHHVFDTLMDELISTFWEVEKLHVKVAKVSDLTCERTTTKEDTPGPLRCRNSSEPRNA